MPEAVLTFEHIDGAMAKVNLADFEAGGRVFAAAKAAPFPQICPIYKAVRPILQILANLPLIPAKWRAVITAFIGVMDALCP